MIKRHPVLSYYAVVFAISWGGVLLLVGGPSGIPGTPQQIDNLIWLVVLPLELGPPVAGLLLTGLVSGRRGYAELGARLTRWRVSARWYAVALLTAPLVATAVVLGLSLTSSKYLPAIVTADDKTSVLLVGLITGLLGGFGEELGWTGFVTPRLRLRHSIMATGLFVGVLWGVWHSSSSRPQRWQRGERKLVHCLGRRVLARPRGMGGCTSTSFVFLTTSGWRSMRTRGPGATSHGRHAT